MHLGSGAGYGVEHGQLAEKPPHDVIKGVRVSLLLRLLLVEQVAHQQLVQFECAVPKALTFPLRIRPGRASNHFLAVQRVLVGIRLKDRPQ